VLVEFIYDAPVQRALTSGYWIEMGLVFAIIFFAWALSRKIIRFAISSGAIFTGWWFIALLSFEQLPDMTFGAAVAFYVVVAGIITAFLAYLRTMVMRKV
jgi:hypothetical protein